MLFPKIFLSSDLITFHSESDWKSLSHEIEIQRSCFGKFVLESHPKTVRFHNSPKSCLIFRNFFFVFLDYQSYFDHKQWDLWESNRIVRKVKILTKSCSSPDLLHCLVRCGLHYFSHCTLKNQPHRPGQMVTDTALLSYSITSLTYSITSLTYIITSAVHHWLTASHWHH